MNFRKLTLATLAVFIISNVLTTVWYMITDEANFVPYRRAEINYTAMLLNHLIYATIFVYLFPYFYKTYLKISKGFIYGILMSAVMFIPQALVIRSIWEVDINTIFFMNTIAHLIIGGLMGLATAIIYNHKNVER